MRYIFRFIFFNKKRLGIDSNIEEVANKVSFHSHEFIFQINKVLIPS